MDNDSIFIPISPGELIDRITILRIKKARIIDPEKLSHVDRELALLEAKLDVFPDSPEITELTNALYEANLQIWEGEERIRAHWDDDGEALAASRLSHTGNDERFRIKQKINSLVGSEITEVKSHQN